jgi:HEAT repeat protein
MNKLVVASSLVVYAAVATAAALSQTQINLLTPIDSVPTASQLNLVFNGPTQARDSLLVIAQDDTADTGIRLRAIHALAKYCPAVTGTCTVADPAHQALSDLISVNRTSHLGSPALLLRAAIESIGLLQVQTDVDVLTPLLDHQSRDIRAATAHALRDLCNTQAINPLRLRYAHETSDQVRLAISDALRNLPCP